MIHRGEIIEQAVRNSGMSITKIAQKMGKSRRWMYLMFDNPKVDYETVLKIGVIINYDFSVRIRSLYRHEGKNIPMILSDSENEPYQKSDPSLRQTGYEQPVSGQRHTDEYWREKYFKLLEEHYELLKKLK